MDGRETAGVKRISNNSLTPINSVGEQIGATVYNKFSLEMRYPLKSSASICNGFFRAGSSYEF
jgi:outer membrane protein insertion porin family